MKFYLAGIAGAAVTGVLAIAGSLATADFAQAALVNLTYDLELNGMSSGTCPGGVCGIVTVVGDTASSLTYTIDLAPGVSFHGNHSGSSGTGPVLYFELTEFESDHLQRRRGVGDDRDEIVLLQFSGQRKRCSKPGELPRDV